MNRACNAYDHNDYEEYSFGNNRYIICHSCESAWVSQYETPESVTNRLIGIIRFLWSE